MKNSGKKILASLALGVIGAMTLTGCSMTEDQQDALDTALTRSEELIEVLEEQNEKNVEIISKLEEQNSELQESNEKYENIIKQLQDQNIDIHKQKIAEIITENRNAWVFSDIEKFKFTRTIEGYYGYFDELTYNSDSTYVIAKEGDSRIVYHTETTQDSSLTIYSKVDVDANINYQFRAQNDATPQFTTGDGFESFSFTGVDIFIQVGLRGEITPEEIYDVELTENGYKFKLMSIQYDKSDSVVHVTHGFGLYELDVEITNDKISKVDCLIYSISDDMSTEDIEEGIYYSIFNSSYDNVSTTKMSVTYDYENIDLTDIKNKLSEIENEYLTQDE